jgi:transcriptional regulator with XRE-family HTH domain
MKRTPEFDWHLSEWMGDEISQAELCRRTGYPKAKMSELVNGVTRYNRDVVNDLSKALNIRPYELLMAPDQARAFRSYLASAQQLITLAHDAEDAPRNDLADQDYKKNREPARKAPARRAK